MAIAVDLCLTEKLISGSAMLITRLIAVIVIGLATMLIPFFVSYGGPHLKILLVILEPRAWQGAMQFLTQPVLFLLVNLVILSIWATSAAACDAVADDPMKEEKFQSGWGAPKAKLQQISSSSKSMTASSASEVHNVHSKSLCSEILCEARTPQVECSSFQVSSKTQIPASVSKAKGAIAREPKRSYSLNSKPSNSSDRWNHTSNKPSSSNSRATAATKTSKFEKRSASFQVPSRVIVRDVSCEENCMPEMLVLEKDELNERIEAFFARFREQLRRESLGSQ